MFSWFVTLPLALFGIVALVASGYIEKFFKEKYGHHLVQTQIPLTYMLAFLLIFLMSTIWFVSVPIFAAIGLGLILRSKLQSKDDTKEN
jgi:hypothetical protein